MHKIQHFLGNCDGLRHIAREAQRLAELDRAYRGVVPASLAEASGVEHLDGGTLFLWADGGAVAAKLRQLVPMVRDKLAPLAPECSSIRVVVRIGGPDVARRDPAPRSIGQRGTEALQALARELPPSPLRAALVGLSARRAGRSQNGE